MGFWSAIAGVGATLLGLAFVTFQLRAEQWRSKRLRYLVAVFTLSELGGPVAIALVCLMPNHLWRQASFASAAVGLVLFVRYRLAVKRERKLAPLDKFDKLMSRLSWFTFVVLMLLGLAATIPKDTSSLAILGGCMVWLLISGATECWIFIFPEMAGGNAVTSPDPTPMMAPSSSLLP